MPPKKQQSQQQPKKKVKSKTKQPNNTSVANVPVSIGTIVKVNAPTYSNTSQIGVTIYHKELVGGLTSSVTADIFYGFAVNPGLDTTFPWLSGVAAQYEEYRFNSLKFHYVTRVSTTTAGNILTGFDADAADQLPDREEELGSFAHAMEGPAWRNHTMTVDKRLLQRWLYVRSSGLDNNQDIKTYDTGKFIAMLTRDSNAQIWGKLWVEFSINLRGPQKSLRNVSGEMISVPIATGVGNLPMHGLLNNSIVSNFGNLSGGVGYRRLGGLVIYPSLADGNATNGSAAHLSINGLRPGFVYHLVTYTAGTGNSYLTPPSIYSGATQTFLNFTGSNAQSTQWASLAANNSLFAAGDITFKVNPNTFQVVILYSVIIPTTQPSFLVRVQEVGSNSLF